MKPFSTISILVWIILFSTVNLHQVPAEKKEVRFTSDVSDALSAYGDREMISTVLRILINNAVKYSYEGGMVKVAITEKGEKGTGLGLILCKDFVEKNRGRIWSESQEGSGTKFYFTIPTHDPNHV